MDGLLQVLGGLFYLLNKVFLWLSEHTQGNRRRSRQWRIASWAVYLAGLPPWVILFVCNRNWIAATVEASGAPAMLLGLLTALRGTTEDPPRWLDRLALICIPLGFAYSLYDFGGLTSFTQWLEIGLVAGYLVGTYQLAKERRSGYLWYVLMHLACGWLMWVQGYPWLFWQQMVSLVFIVDACRVARK
ncbi:MAG TPA: hypothetical protein VJC16_00800 [Candidatus Nanoarchaeia archaeon]|nr:hypothetical protein [Candidatus Nanoarchaeia archaeon]